VTAAWLPDGIEWKAFNGLIKGHGVILAGGQGKLTGKIFRVGHLGSVTVEDVLDVIAVLERVSVEVGRAIEPGHAVGAAQAAALAVQTGPHVESEAVRPTVPA
jgi:aspartate aminotransferase-like enzyme